MKDKKDQKNKKKKKVRVRVLNFLSTPQRNNRLQRVPESHEPENGEIHFLNF